MMIVIMNLAFTAIHTLHFKPFMNEYSAMTIPILKAEVHALKHL